MLTSTKAEGATLKEKQEWLTSAAHDLKNPLSAIFGYADTLLDTPAGAGMSPDQRMILGRIRGTASRATELVRNYQHLSLLALKGIAQSGTRSDLNGAIHDLLNTTWREDPEHPRVVVNLLSEALPALIDRLHLDRILSNLFSNALKFSPPNSTVTVRSGRDDSGFAWVSFNNSGAPIAEAELATLFTPFNRLSNSRGKPGSGLGLTIVRRIVDGLGGRISVSSSQEEGTTFTVKLPM
jgi:signal transduction histidine kinase